MKTVQKILFLFLIFVLQACGSSPPPVPVDPTLTSIQENIFNQSCALSSCHNASAQKGNLNLTAGASLSNLINIPAFDTVANALGKVRVKPGDPNNSFLVQKLEGPPADEGFQMPQNNQKLPDQYIQAIRQWITNGAKNN